MSQTELEFVNGFALPQDSVLINRRAWFRDVDGMRAVFVDQTDVVKGTAGAHRLRGLRQHRGVRDGLPGGRDRASERSLQGRGLLGEVGDVEGMAAMATSVLSDPGRNKEMRHAARQRAVKEFPTDAVVSRYESLYREVLAR